MAEQIDISNFLQERYPNRNWNFDTIRMTISHALDVFQFEDVSCIYNVFCDIGICELKRLSSIQDIEELSNYYLVHYKPNYQGKSGLHIKDSENYLCNEYADLILKGLNVMPDVYSLIESLKELTYDIDIIIAYDTFINKGLIVDGTKRALALCSIKQTNKEQLTNLLNSTKYSINIIYLKSNVCRILFPLDFCKLCH